MYSIVCGFYYGVVYLRSTYNSVVKRLKFILLSFSPILWNAYPGSIAIFIHICLYTYVYVKKLI